METLLMESGKVRHNLPDVITSSTPLSSREKLSIRLMKDLIENANAKEVPEDEAVVYLNGSKYTEDL